MEELCLPITILNKTGLFMPKQFSKYYHKPLWIIYSLIVHIIMFSLAIDLIINLVLSESINQFLERMIIVPGVLSCFFKSIFINTFRRRILDTEKVFLSRICLSESIKEESMKKKHIKLIRFVKIKKKFCKFFKYVFNKKKIFFLIGLLSYFVTF